MAIEVRLGSNFSNSNMSGYFLSNARMHHVWNRALVPSLKIASGDTVKFECHDSSDSEVTPESIPGQNS